MYHPRMTLTDDERVQLIRDIATRAGTAQEIAKWYGMSLNKVKAFVDENREAIEGYAEMGRAPVESAADVSPKALADLWITNKSARLTRLQNLAEVAYADAMHGNLAGTELATALREFRSYLMLAANELGQLLHRGAGDNAEGEVLEVSISGIDMETLK